MSYHPSSSALTGRAPRSMRDAFGCSMHDPLYAMPEDDAAGLIDALGRAARAIGDLLAGLFGR